MNTQLIVVELTMSAVFVAFAWIFFHWVYRDYRVDVYRQELFRIRDDFFDLASKGQLRFDHPVYGMLRTVFNGSIRFAHELDFIRMIVLLVAHIRSLRTRDFHRFRSELEEHMRTLPSSVRKEVERIYLRLGVCHLKHLVLTSSLLWALVLPLIVLLFVLLCVYIGSQFIGKFIGFDFVNDEARRLGSLNAT
jgi:hypothetical protein